MLTCWLLVVQRVVDLLQICFFSANLSVTQSFCSLLVPGRGGLATRLRVGRIGCVVGGVLAANCTSVGYRVPLAEVRVPVSPTSVAGGSAW